MKTQLLCTFTTQHNLEQSIRDITKNFKVVFDKIYVLQNEEKQKELICTYNVNKDDKIDFNSVNNTISLHRKKITNTLYTINALNELIKLINNGVLDTNYQGNEIFGVDVAEQQAIREDNSQYRPASSGWVGITSYTDNHGNQRVKTEVLVAKSTITADASDDTILPDT